MGAGAAACQPGTRARSWPPLAQDAASLASPNGPRQRMGRIRAECVSGRGIVMNSRRHLGALAGGRPRDPSRPSGSMIPMSTSTSSSPSTDIQALLGDDADALLGYTAKAFPAEHLTLPSPNYLSEVFTNSDRSPTVLRNLGWVFDHGRLGGTGYVS